MARLFGTDGVRGRANDDITAELAVELSVGAAHVLGTLGAFGGTRPRAIVARDTRPSGHFLAAAVSAGLASAGVDVLDAEVVVAVPSGSSPWLASTIPAMTRTARAAAASATHT